MYRHQEQEERHVVKLIGVRHSLKQLLLTCPCGFRPSLVDLRPSQGRREPEQRPCVLVFITVPLLSFSFVSSPTRSTRRAARGRSQKTRTGKIGNGNLFTQNDIDLRHLRSNLRSQILTAGQDKITDGNSGLVGARSWRTLPVLLLLVGAAASSRIQKAISSTSHVCMECGEMEKVTRTVDLHL